MIVIAAMLEEIAPFIESQKMQQISTEPYRVFKKNDLIVIISGIGIANAATAASLACLNYIDNKKDNLIINIGLAGSLNNDFTIFDIVKINNFTFSGADATGFGYVKGQIPREEQYIKNNFTLKSELNSKYKVKEANLASGDTFISNKNNSIDFFKDFPFKIDLVDMEATAIAFTSKKFNQKMLSIKVVSDVMTNDSSTNEQQFNEVLEKGAHKIKEILEDIYGD